MNRSPRRSLVFFALVTALFACVITLPRARFLFEAAMLEFRILWWLLLLAGLGIYFGCVFGRKRDK